MNLLNLMVEIGVKDNATKQANTISTAMIAKANLVADAIKAAAQSAMQAVTGFMNSAVSAYATYEQQIGGMKTFFGDAADTVIENAKKAYDTAGMSANQYMTNVSSFAMSLINSVAKRRSTVVQEDTEEKKKALDSQVTALSKALSKEYNAESKALSKQLSAYSKALSKRVEEQQEANEEALEARKDALDDEYEALEDSLDKEVEAYEKATDARIKEIDREYTERLKLVDEEEYKRVKAIEAQIEALEEQGEAEDAARKERQNQTKIANLKDEIANAKFIEDKEKAERELADFLEDIDADKRDTTRKNQIKSLKEQKDAIREQADQQRDAIKEEAESTKDAYEEQRAAELKQIKEANADKLEAARESNEDILKELRKSQSKQIKAMREENENAIEAMQDRNDAILESMQESNDNQLEELRNYVADQKEILKSAADNNSEYVKVTAEDQIEAARIADIAIRDMADNANNTGTSIQSIQDAYQGFSKQNFTMLDNLKLGYGGTKEEMERLLEDAEKVKASHGEMADYSIDSFADIVEAIHVVQEEYGFMNTTLDEGMTTIEGATNRVKAAWENWLTSLGDPDYDVVESTEQLMQAVGNAAGLLIPRIAEIIGTIAKYVKEHGPEIWENFKTAMMEALPEEWKEKIQGFIDKVDDFIRKIGEFIDSLGGIDGIVNGASDVIKTFGDAFKTVSDVLGPFAPQIAIAGAALMALSPVIAIGQGIFGAFSGIGGILSSLGGSATTAAGGVGTLTTAAETAAGTAGGGGLTALSGSLSGVGGALASALGTAAIAGGAAAGVGLLTNSVLESTGSIDRFHESVKNGTYNATEQFTHMSTSIQNSNADVVNSMGKVKGSVEKASDDMADSMDKGGTGMANSMKTAKDKVENNVVTMRDSINGTFRNSDRLLNTAGNNIIVGFWNGMVGAWHTVQDWILGIGEWIAQHKGPEQYDRHLLEPAGNWIIGGLHKGLKDSFESDVMPYVSEMAGEMEDAFGNPVLSATGKATISGAKAAAQSQREPKQMNIILELDGVQFARAVYNANNRETQRVGTKLVGGYA